MDWPTLIKDILIPILTIFGAFVGARWGRNAALREKVFDKRIEAHMEIMGAAGILKDRARGLEVSQRLFGFIRRDSYGGFLDLSDDFQQKRHRWSMFLSSDVKNQIDIFQQRLDGLISFYGSELDSKIEPHFEELEHVITAFNVLDQTVRKSLGTDEITRDIHRSLSAPAWSRLWRRT